jgi:PKD repeat protein
MPSKTALSLILLAFWVTASARGEQSANPGAGAPLGGAQTLGQSAVTPEGPDACSLACIASAPASAAVNSWVHFYVAATTGGCAGTPAADWSFGDGSAHASTLNPTHRYTTTGSFTWTATFSTGGASCTKTGSITIEAEPPCTLSCQANATSVVPVAVDASFYGTYTTSYCSSPTVTQEWDFGDGSARYTGNDFPRHQYASAGTYTWRYTASSGALTCTKTGTIRASASSACKLYCRASVWGGYNNCGDSIRFDPSVDQTGCTGNQAYSWEFGDGATSSDPSPSHTYLHAGSYDWTMRVTKGDDVCTTTETISINPPTALACTGSASPRVGAPPLQVNYSASFTNPTCTSVPATLWWLGDGATSLAQSPSRTFGTPGFYTWEMAATADGLGCGDAGPIIVSSSPPAYTWAKQTSGTEAIVEGVATVSATEAWAAAYDGLYHTTDGGLTWSQPAYKGRPLYAIEMRDATTGAVTGSCGFSRTTNSGADWGGFWWGSCTGFSYTDVFPVSGDAVWLSSTAGYLERWTYGQGGQYNGWSQQSLSAPGSGAVWSIFFTDSDNGLAVGSGGRIVRITAASSATPAITQLSSPTTANLYDVRMLNATTGWIVGSNGTILHTSDGATWTQQTSGTSLPLYGIAIADATTAWAVGSKGVVLSTTDGGATWAAEVNQLDQSLLGAATFPRSSSLAPAAASDRLLLAVGNDGTILKRLAFACPTITLGPGALPDATGGVAYSATLAAQGGVAPYSFSLRSGGLPDGLSLSGDGRLSGTPTVGGTFSFVVGARDADGCSSERSYTLDVACGLGCSASAYPSTGKPPLAVNFGGYFTASACGSASPAYLWEFGDGSTAATASPQHTYAATGAYTWTLTITAGGTKCVKTGVVHVVPCLLSCDATLAPSRGPAPLAVAFSATATCESTQVTPSYSWDLGDGATATGAHPRHTYAADGTYSWTMTATAEQQSCEHSGLVMAGASTQSSFWKDVSPSGWDFRDLSFTSPTEGWVAGSNAVLLHTVDAGKSWSPVSTAVTSSQGFNSVHFLNGDTGWVGGGCSAARTTDRGVTWTKVELGCADAWSWVLNRLVPLSSDVAWAVGKVSYTTTLYRLTTSGAVMSYQSWPFYWVSELFDLAFVGPQTALAVGDNGTIVRIMTPAVGEPTVTTLSSGTSVTLSGIAMANANVGWAVGEGGTILHTTDGGQTWSAQNSGTHLGLKRVKFLDATTGWAVGESGLVLGMSDGGASWHVELTPRQDSLLGLDVVNPDAVFAVGSFFVLRRQPCPSFSMTPTSLPAGEAGLAYSARLTLSGGETPYRAWVTGGRLPPGLTLTGADNIYGSFSVSGTPAAAGSFQATVRVTDSGFCSTDFTVTLTVRAPTTCTVACAPDVPSTATTAEPVTFVGNANAFACSGALTHDWDFGDGSGHSTEASTQHRYTTAGMYAWRLTSSASGATCTRDGSIEVGEGLTYRYLVPAVAHQPGAGGTLWRTDVAVVNVSEATAYLTLTFRNPAPVSRQLGLGGKGAVEYGNILESVFGLASNAQSSGSLEIVSSRPLAATSRTYNLTPSGTFGQHYPALTQADALTPGQTGVLPQLKRNSSFRTNVGIANLGTTAVTVEVKLFNASGKQVGSTKTVTADPSLWSQTFDIFSAAGAGMQDVACATVQVASAAGKAWVYASLVDAATGDPTTIPAQPISASSGPTTYLIPSVAHIPGAGGTLWRTDVGLANRSSEAASLVLTYRAGGAPVTGTRSLAAGATAEWGNVVESVLGLGAASSVSGSLALASSVPIYLSARTYNLTTAGTFGQLYPALASSSALARGEIGFLPQLKKNAAFRTNLGFVNLGEANVTVAFTLFDANGTKIGSTKVVTAGPQEWAQQYDIFANVGAGSRDVAYAVVEVQTEGGRVWAYASVVDSATGDPTTIPMLVP